MAKDKESSASPSSKKATTTKYKAPGRLVQFYQLKQRAEKYKEPDTQAIRDALAKLDLKGTVLKTPAGDVRLFDKTPDGGKDVRLVIWLSRNDMCGRELGGDEHSLNITDGSRLLEKAHAIFFDGAYLAFLFNHRAAHAESVVNYLNKHCTADLGLLKLRPWISEDTINKIKYLLFGSVASKAKH